MELTQLRYFLEVARNEHMTKSAEKLHIAQPSLTKTIHNLEDELGVPLFVPSGRNIVLSEYGRYLKERLEPIMAELDGLPAAMQDLANLKNETIHVNVLAASIFVTEAIIEYKREHSEIKFEFLQNSREDIYDIRISTSPAAHGIVGYHADSYVCLENIYVAVPNTERFRGRTGIHLSEIMNESFISLSDSREFRIVCDKLCQHAGFKPNIVFESDSPMAVKNMIASDMGLGFWPQFTWGREGDERIRLLNIEDCEFARNVVITHRLNKADNSNVLDFFKFICDYCEKAKSGS